MNGREFVAAVLAVAVAPCLGCPAVLGDFRVGDPCAERTDCSACADSQTCFSCLQDKHPEGAPLYQAFASCTICVGCYTTCQGSQYGCTAPAQTDACDTGTPGQATACVACDGCAILGTCSPESDACQASADCHAYEDELSGCP
jgi:hypothetical protein